MKEMTTEVMQEAQEFISGSCMHSPEFCLMTVLKREPTQEEEDLFNIYLYEKEVFECEVCGWWSYPGEEPEGTCSDCLGDDE